MLSKNYGYCVQWNGWFCNLSKFIWLCSRNQNSLIFYLSEICVCLSWWTLTCTKLSSFWSIVTFQEARNLFNPTVDNLTKFYSVTSVMTASKNTGFTVQIHIMVTLIHCRPCASTTGEINWVILLLKTISWYVNEDKLSTKEKGENDGWHFCVTLMTKIKLILNCIKSFMNMLSPLNNIEVTCTCSALPGTKLWWIGNEFEWKSCWNERENLW